MWSQAKISEHKVNIQQLESPISGLLEGKALPVPLHMQRKHVLAQ